MRPYLKMTLSGLRAFFRDRAGLFWSFFFPIFFIVIFGSIFSGSNEKNISFPVGIVVQDPSPNVAWIVNPFHQIPVLDLHTGTLPDETEALRTGKRQAVVVFPTDFSAQMKSGTTTNVKILYDPAQQQTAQAAIAVIREALAGIEKSVSHTPTLFAAVPEPLAAPGKKGQEADGIDFLLPGILAMTVMQLGLFTAIPLINMREKGLLKRLRATPLPRITIVGSQVTFRLIIGFVQTLVLLSIGMGFYKFHVNGSWPLLFLAVVVGALTFICIGAVLSSVAKTQESGMPLVQLVQMPMLFLSNLIFPAALLPSYLHGVTKFLPATYLADMVRHATLGTSVYSLPTSLAVMGVWMLGSLFLASRLFRWE